MQVDVLLPSSAHLAYTARNRESNTVHRRSREPPTAHFVLVLDSVGVITFGECESQATFLFFSYPEDMLTYYDYCTGTQRLLSWDTSKALDNNIL